MPADPALTARLIEAAARAIAGERATSKAARAALAAVCREAGLDADALHQIANAIVAEWAGRPVADRTAALLRALAEIADG